MCIRDSGCIATLTANGTGADDDATLCGFGRCPPERDLQLMLAFDVLDIPCCELFSHLTSAPLTDVLVHEVLEVARNRHQMRGAYAESDLAGVVELVSVRDGTDVESV